MITDKRESDALLERNPIHQDRADEALLHSVTHLAAKIPYINLTTMTLCEPITGSRQKQLNIVL